MKYYPDTVCGDFFDKPWNKDPYYINNQYFNGSSIRPGCFFVFSNEVPGVVKMIVDPLTTQQLVKTWVEILEKSLFGLTLLETNIL